MPAAGKSDQRVLCRINLSGTMRNGVPGIVIESDIRRTDLFQKPETILRQIEQVILSISRIFQSNDHLQALGVCGENSNVPKKAVSVCSACRVGVDDLDAEFSRKIHPPRENRVGIRFA